MVGVGPGEQVRQVAPSLVRAQERGVGLRALDQGLDFVMVGRAGIVHHDFPLRAFANTEFVMTDLPVSREHLRQERLGPPFIDYMATWKGFVAD